MYSEKSQAKLSTCFDFLKRSWYKLASISIRIAGKIASHNELCLIDFLRTIKRISTLDSVISQNTSKGN